MLSLKLDYIKLNLSLPRINGADVEAHVIPFFFFLRLKRIHKIIQKFSRTKSTALNLGYDIRTSGRTNHCSGVKTRGIKLKKDSMEKYKTESGTDTQKYIKVCNFTPPFPLWNTTVSWGVAIDGQNYIIILFFGSTSLTLSTHLETM